MLDVDDLHRSGYPGKSNFRAREGFGCTTSVGLHTIGGFRHSSMTVQIENEGEVSRRRPC